MKEDANKIKTTIVAKIPKELDKLLVDKAKSTHRSKSGMIAEIISAFFGGQKNAETKS